MGVAGHGDNWAERLALRLNLAPRPVAELMWGMGTSRALIAAARLGVLAELAKGPATLEELAARCGLEPEPAGPAAEVARRLALLGRAPSLLDVAGGHGWYSAELCRRHPGLRATVLDLPGSAAIGREIIATAGLSDWVGSPISTVTRSPRTSAAAIT